MLGAVVAIPVWLATSSPPEQPTAESSSPSEVVAEEPMLPASLDASSIPAEIPVDLSPQLLTAEDDRPDIYERGCHVSRSDIEPVGCTYGDTSGPTILLSGDSKAAQWVPALADLAEQGGWNLQVFTKSGCPLEPVRMNWGPRLYTECEEWRDKMKGVIADLAPDLIVLASLDHYRMVDDEGTALEEPDRSATFVADVIDLLHELGEQGHEVVYIADTPTPVGHIPDCLSSEGSVSACTASREQALEIQLHEPAVSQVEGASLIDLTDSLCTSSVCPPIIGSTLVYRDEGHLTMTMVRSLEAEIANQLRMAGFGQLVESVTAYSPVSSDSSAP
jgi:hypothetical protein